MKVDNENLSNTLFIPAPIDRKRKPKISNKKWILGIVFGLCGVIIAILWYSHVDNNYLYGSKRSIQIIIGELIIIYVEYKLFYYLVIDVKKIIKHYKEYKKSQICKACVAHFIIRYGDDGRIFYADGSEGYIIKLNRSYTFGRPQKFINDSYDNFTKVFTDLLEKGYYLYWGLLNTGKSNIDPLLNLSKNVQQYKHITVDGHSIAELPMALINYDRRLLENVKTPMEYLVIETNGTAIASKQLKLMVQKSLLLLKDSIYEKSEIIIDKESHFMFEKDYFGLSKLYPADLYQKNIKSSSVIKIIKTEKPEKVIDNLEEFTLEQEYTEYDDIVRALTEVNAKSEDTSHTDLISKKEIKPLKPLKKLNK